MLEGGSVDHGPPLFLLLDEPAGGEKPQMMSQSRGRQTNPLLDLSDGKAFMTRSNQSQQYFEPRFPSRPRQTLVPLLRVQA